MIKEYYANIKGYEDLYQVSNYGTVKSITHYRKGKNGKEQIVRGRILQANVDRKRGYLSVTLSKNGVSKTHRIHRLVAETFVPNPNRYDQINHIDGDKLNNYFENLEWCTCKDNINHAWRNNLCKISDKHRIVASKTQKKRWENYRKNKNETGD